MSKRVWHGRQGYVSVGKPIDDADIDEEDPQETLEELLAGVTDQDEVKYDGAIMDIDISDAAADVEVENTFGGQFKVQTPAELVEIDVTMRFEDIQIFEEMHGEAETVGDTDYDRISGSREPGNRKERAFLFKVEDNGDEVVYLINNAIFNQMGDVTLDAEGFAEVSGTVVALVEDRYIEDNFSA